MTVCKTRRYDADMADYTGQDEGRVRDIQQVLRDHGALDGWLFCDFRHNDPLAYRVLHIDPVRHVTRRWYYWIPAHGRPVKLVHRIEPHTLDVLPGDQRVYVGWRELHAHLAETLRGVRRVAMQYSPMNAIPYVSRVDAGTVDLIRGLGIEVVTSADLIQRFEAVWNPGQLRSHQEAAEALRDIVDEAFQHVAARQRAQAALSEYDLQQFILSRITAHGLITGSAPIAAVGPHTADPHYAPTTEGSAPIEPGQVVLIDLWAKRPARGSVYADITWTGYVGEEVPDRPREVFAVVSGARDAALEFVTRRVGAGDYPCGYEVDDVCRQVIRSAGYGEHFLHRTGHSIGEEVHGNGANIDNLETQDGRRLLMNTCFSIEPGIYLPGAFGIRSEIDVYVGDRAVVVAGQPMQTEMVPILSM